MEKLQYSIDINAPKSKVWDTMLEDATYRDWTTAFSEGSHFVGDWSEGSRMLFLGPGENGDSGMVSRIATNRPHEFLSIEHLGFIQDGKEDLTSDAVKKWSGVHENYTFTESGGGTKLDIEIDMDEEYVEMFNEMWPSALQRLKVLSEG